MKLSTLSQALWISSLAAFASVVPLAHAQAGVRMTVPFAFDCGHSHLAAGTYTVTKDGSFATLRSSKTTSVAIALTFQNDRRDETSRALFSRVGNRYTLKDVWSAGESEHLHFVTAKPKHQPALASNELPAQEVEVALTPGALAGGR